MPPGVAVSRLASLRRGTSTSGRVIRSVLLNPSLRRVLIAFLLFNAVEFGTWIAVLLYAYDASGPTMVGVVALAQLMPAAAIAPVASSIADRLPRQRVLLGGYVLQAIAFGATGAGMLAGAPPLLVYATAAIAATSLTVTRPAQGSLLPSLARTPEELTAANGLAGTVEGAGLLVGPLIAAAILSLASPGAVFALGGIGCAVAVLLTLGLPVDRRRDSEGPGGEHQDRSPRALVFEGLRTLSANADTRIVVLVLALRMLASGATDVLFVLLALEVYHTGKAGAGILVAAMGLGTVLGGAASFALVGRQRLARALAARALVWGLAIVALGTVAPALLAPVVMVAGGVGFAAADVAGRTLLQRVTPDHQLARILGALEGIGLAFLAIGSAGLPLLVPVIGIHATLIVVGLVLPGSVALAWTRFRAIDRSVHVPVRELALLRRSAVFASLPPPQLESVAGRTRWVTLEAGKVLIREGDPGDRFYILESGSFRVTIAGRQVSTVEEPGEGIGEIALLRGVPRTATVTALGPCVLLALEREPFLEAVTGHDGFRAAIERAAAGRAMGTPGPT